MCKITPRTRSCYLPVIISKPDLKCQLLIRVCKFYKKSLTSVNPVLQEASKLASNSLSDVGINVKELFSVLKCNFVTFCNHNANNLLKLLEIDTVPDNDIKCISNAILELCRTVDTCNAQHFISSFNLIECKLVLDLLCESAREGIG